MSNWKNGCVSNDFSDDYETLTFDEPYLQEAFDEYMISVNNIEGRLKRIERRLEEIACDDAIAEKVKKLLCFCGIDTVSAVSIVSEVGDFNRFARAWDFSNFIGLTVGENSSGDRFGRLGITKSGNSYLRRLLTGRVQSIKRSNTKGNKSHKCSFYCSCKGNGMFYLGNDD